MAFKTLEKGASELGNMYPRFDEIGDYVEGNICAFVDDDYGNKRIEIYKGEYDDGEIKTQLLPAYADLKKYYSQLKVGDYVRIEFIKSIPSNNENYSDKKIFKVQVDASRFLEFEGE